MKFNRLIPELDVSNLKRSERFYVGKLGFKREYARKGFVFLSFQGSQLMLEEGTGYGTGPLRRPYGRGVNFHIEVDAIAPLVRRLRQKKVPSNVAPYDAWYSKGDVLLGCREFLVQDPDGYLLRFSQDIGVKRMS